MNTSLGQSRVKGESKSKSGTSKAPRDQVCNSYLQSYQNFTDESGLLACTAEKALSESKKGNINKTLAALHATSPTKKRTATTTSRIRPESPVRRGVGDCGMGDFSRTNRGGSMNAKKL
jgi:hypothetical protein